MNVPTKIRATGALSLMILMLATALAQGGDVRRIKFQRGRSSSIVKSNVGSDAKITYLVAARAGQTMSLSISRGAAFRLSSPSDNTLEGGKAVSSTTQELAETGDYRIVVESLSTRAKTAFTLEVVIQ